MTLQQTAVLKKLNDIMNGIGKYRDKLAVYFDDSDTMTAAQKTAVGNAVTTAKAALDSFNSDIQAL
jgi:hypothetical protein